MTKGWLRHNGSNTDSTNTENTNNTNHHNRTVLGGSNPAGGRVWDDLNTIKLLCYQSTLVC